MSDNYLTESTAYAESHKESSPQREQPKALQWIAYAALAIAVLAVILAALAYLVQAHNSASATAQQGGDAKANVCAAYAATRKAVVLNTHLKSPNPDSQLAVAANARLALIGGGAYLSQRLAANTAAPADLANAANSLANTIQQLGINYLNQAPGRCPGSRAKRPSPTNSANLISCAHNGIIRDSASEAGGQAEAIASGRRHRATGAGAQHFTEQTGEFLCSAGSFACLV